MDKDANANPRAYRQAQSTISQALGDMGLPDEWLKPTLELVARESSYNPEAANPGSSAKGMFQFLDKTRENYGGSSVDWSDPYQQSIKGLQYIIDRYKTPEAALKYWDQHKSY